MRLFTLVLGIGCAPGRFEAEEISRLTIDAIAAIAEIVADDEICGFESPSVIESETVTGTFGSEGAVTRVVSDCEIDLDHIDENLPIIFDCEGVRAIVTGGLRVSATRTVGGRIDDDDEDPVVPAGNYASALAITRASLRDFSVRDVEKDESITIESGSISGNVEVKLARGKDGFCDAPTPHAAFTAVAYEGAVVEVVAAERRYERDIPDSALSAVRGDHRAGENLLFGSISLGGSRRELVDVPLDLAYDREAFDRRFVCEDNEDLSLPLSYECDGVGGLLAQGIARLTVKSLAEIVSRLDDDTTCGFESALVEGSPILDGPIGGIGTATFETECAMDLGAETLLDTDCDGVQTIGGGRITIHARKIMAGRLTGDVEDPVVPLAEDAVRIEILSSTFDGLWIREEETRLDLVSGGITGTIVPRIARDAEDDACSFETDVARFEDLSYLPSEVVAEGYAGRFAARVDASNILASSGEWNGAENLLTGSITLAGIEHILPTDPNDVGLDPDYDRAAFAKSWQCGTLELPVSYDCSVAPDLAQGAARAAALILGRIGELIDEDTACGFDSSRVKRAAATAGELGHDGGEVTFTLDVPCKIDLPPATEIDLDCNGKATFAGGRVNVSGTKRVTGYITGDPNEPVVPTSRDAAVLELSLSFADFEIWESPSDEKIRVSSGALFGRLEPRAALDVDSGACEIGTPVVTFDPIRWTDAQVSLIDEGRRFDGRISTSDLEAQAGDKDGVTNRLKGTLAFDGDTFTIPVDPDDPGLDDDYVKAEFDAGYQTCDPLLRMPETDRDCDFRAELAKGAARLIVKGAGGIAEIAADDDDCGFSDTGVLTDPVQVIGDEGDYGALHFRIEGCEIDRPVESGGPPTLGDEDCLDRETYASGKITVDSTMVVEGERDEICIFFSCFDIVTPKKPDSTRMVLERVLIDELEVFDGDPGGPRLEGITIHSGTLAAEVLPHTGENDGDLGDFTVETPVAGFERIDLREASITLRDDDGKTFAAVVSESDLNAFNGGYAGTKNRIAGSIVVDGRRFDVGEIELDEDYDQQDFDRRYVCTDDLVETLPPDGRLGVN